MPACVRTAPDIDLPDIDLPDIDLPDIDLPDRRFATQLICPATSSV
jgi:hypothetical protein